MCNYKLHVVVFAIIYLLILTGLGIGLAVHYNNKMKIDNFEKSQFNTTNFTVIGYDTYLDSCVICNSKHEPQKCYSTSAFYPYAILKYRAYFNNTYENCLGYIKRNDWCDTDRNAVLNFIKNKYPLNSTFIAYYNITNSSDWRNHLPSYQSYDVNFFIMIIVILMICIIILTHVIFYTLWYYRNKNELSYTKIIS